MLTDKEMSELMNSVTSEAQAEMTSLWHHQGKLMECPFNGAEWDICDKASEKDNSNQSITNLVSDQDAAELHLSVNHQSLSVPALLLSSHSSTFLCHQESRYYESSLSGSLIPTPGNSIVHNTSDQNPLDWHAHTHTLTNTHACIKLVNPLST